MAAMVEEAAERIAPHVVRTSVFHSESLSDRAQVYVKNEGEQIGRNFKARGAFRAYIHNIELGIDDYWVPSAGSQLIGLALARQEYGGSLVGIVPESTPDGKVNLAEQHGAQVIRYGKTFAEAEAYGREQFKATRRKLIHPFANRHVMAGQGTVGLEIVQAVQSGVLPRPDYVLAPMGGGGLAPAVAAIIKKLMPETGMVGVQVEGCDALVRSLRSGRPERATGLDLRFGGVAVDKVHPLNLALAGKVLDAVVTVPAASVYSTLDTLYHETGILYEEAGGVAPAASRRLAGLPEFAGATFVAVATGANPGKAVGPYAAMVARREKEDSRLTHGADSVRMVA